MAAPLVYVPRARCYAALQDSAMARSASEPLLPVSVPAMMVAPSEMTAASKLTLISRAEQPVRLSPPLFDLPLNWLSAYSLRPFAWQGSPA